MKPTLEQKVRGMNNKRIIKELDLFKKEIYQLENESHKLLIHKNFYKIAEKQNG